MNTAENSHSVTRYAVHSSSTDPELGLGDLRVFWLASVVAMLVVIAVVALKMNGADIRVALLRSASFLAESVAGAVHDKGAVPAMVVQSKMEPTAHN